MGDPAVVDVRGRLDPNEVRAVTSLVEAVTEADGVRPLSEHVMLHLRYGGEARVRNVLVRAGGQLAAYAHLDVTDEVSGASAELTVHPAHRGRGLGRLVVQALLAATVDGRLRLWAHGQQSGAAALARSMGFEEARALWQMRRSLYSVLPQVPMPVGVSVRTFVPGRDDDEWLALNARAFAGHPEQGEWTLEDLRRRLAEPWFDPAGFFIAERSGRMVGFHWTKVHGGGGNGQGHGHEPIGEVYVVGVDPDEQGHGLGRALTVVGLRHLRHLGLAEAMLYVEADNLPAIKVYTALGFTHWDTDTMFRR